MRPSHPSFNRRFVRQGIAVFSILVTISVPLESPARAVACSVPVVNGVFTVSTEAHLALIGTDTNCSAESFVLANDIALSASPWAPIADFEGTFDGNGHAITNLQLSGIDAGLFNVAANGATFSDLDITVASTTGAVDRVGALVGVSLGSLDIDHVDVTGNVLGTSDGVAGLVGWTSGSIVDISDSSMTGNVGGQSNVGGFVGFAPNATMTILDSPMTGNVTGTGNYVGGIAGFPNGSSVTVTRSPVDGDVEGAGYVGGSIGFSANGAISIVDSPVLGDVSGSNGYVGGVVGMGSGLSTVSVSGSGVTGSVTGTGYVGGVLGFVPNASVSVVDSPVLGDVIGTSFNVGGVVGMAGGLSTVSVSGSGVTGSVTGTGYVGGVLGFVPNASLTIASSPIDGDVTATTMNVGGLVGMMGSGPTETLSVSESGVGGAVSGTHYVGGVAGFVPNAAVTIESSPVVGDVTGTGDNVGGLLGYLGGSSSLVLSHASFSGNVTGDDYVGGLAGFVPNAPITVTSTSVVGDVTASGNNSGGLVGYAAANGTISVSDTVVNGVTTGSQYVGGLLGFVPNASVIVEDTVVRGDVTGDFDLNVLWSGNNVGGLVGMHSASSSASLIVRDSRVEGNTSGSQYIGGLVGFVPGVSITVERSAVIGDVHGASDQSVLNSGTSVAGFFGSSSTSEPISVSESFVSGTISGAGSVGGMFGFVPAADLTISESFVRGSVVGSGDGVAGFVAEIFSDVIVESSFVRASISGHDEVGGFFGMNLGNLTLDDSYYQGIVTSSGTDRGELWATTPVGQVATTDTFCTGTLCPQVNTITIGELKSATFLEGRGWDVTNVWCVRSDLNDGFPVLRDIITGSLDATRCRPLNVAIWRVELDPAGGTCTDGANTFSNKRVSVFVGYRYLPSSADCRREGHEFVGWADVAKPSTALKLPLLVDPSDGAKRLFFASHGDLIAVWKKSPVELDDLSGTAPGTFVGGPDRPTREGGGVVDGFYIPPNTKFWSWMLAR